MAPASNNPQVTDTDEKADSEHVSTDNGRKKIQVSSTKKQLFFYVNLAKRLLRTENEVELSALGLGYPC